MERTQSGLFAMHVAELTPKVSVEGPVGAYDPVEQLWHDEGTVVAQEDCVDIALVLDCEEKNENDKNACKKCAAPLNCAINVIVAICGA